MGENTVVLPGQDFGKKQFNKPKCHSDPREEPICLWGIRAEVNLFKPGDSPPLLFLRTTPFLFRGYHRAAQPHFASRYSCKKS